MEHFDFGPLLAGDEPDVPEAPDAIPVPKALRFTFSPWRYQVNLLSYAIKHLFVPPELPNELDVNQHLESALLGVLRDCAQSFTRRLESGSDARAGWQIICTMLTSFTKLYSGGLTEDSVETALASMTPGGENLCWSSTVAIIY
jgi:hypothetical protein